MEFQFLGTSSGAPTKERNVSGLALRLYAGRSWALIDCGEGTQHQILHTGFSLDALAAIFISHLHGDHWYGLPGLLASAGLGGRREPLLVVGPKPLAEILETLRRADALELSYPLEVVDVAELSADFVIRGAKVTAHPTSHRMPTHAFRFEEARVERRLDADALTRAGVPRGPSWGALQAGEPAFAPNGAPLDAARFLLPARAPRALVVGADNDTPELLAAACEGAHALIHEATYTQAVAEKIGPAPMHSAAAQIAAFAETVGAPALILTHFSSRYRRPGAGGASIEEIAEEARAAYSGALHLANDFDMFRLSPEGALSLEPRG